MEHEEKKGMSPMVIGLIVIAVIAVAAIGVVSMQSSGDSTGTTTTTTPAMVNESPSPEAIQEAQAYRDGTYTVVGEYTSPGGAEELGVEVTLVNSIITEVDVEVKAERPISVKMQEDFAANYETMVVGKPIDEVNLGKVSGSSLTPNGFNDALQKVKAEATT